MMQSFGLDQMGAYPFVRAAIIGHANKESPTNCRQVVLLFYLFILVMFFCKVRGHFNHLDKELPTKNEAVKTTYKSKNMTYSRLN